MKTYQISDAELMDMGCTTPPELIVTDEILLDLSKKGINVK